LPEISGLLEGATDNQTSLHLILMNSNAND